MLRLIFVLSVFVPGLILALRDRFSALLLYIWFALFRPQEYVWIDITSLNLSLIIGLVLVGPCLLTHRWPDLSHPLSKGSFLMAICAILALPGASNPQFASDWTFYLLKLILVCLLATRLVDNNHKLVLVVWTIACSLGLHTSKAGFMSLLAGGVRFDEGLGGAFSTNNGYALGSAMIVFFLFTASHLCTDRWARRGFFCAAVLSAFTVVCTFSRGGFLALTAGFISYTILQGRSLKPMIVLSVLALVVLPFVPIPQGYLDRLHTIGEFEVSSEMSVYEEGAIVSANSRFHFWEVAILMAVDHPFGVGLRNFSNVYDSYDTSEGRYGYGRDCHSSYFQMVAETGFGGGLLFAWLLFYACIILLRVRARSIKLQSEFKYTYLYFTVANGIFSSIVAFIVGGAFGSYALSDLTWYSIAITAALDKISSSAVNLNRETI